MNSTTCGIDYILECINRSKSNHHYAYLTDDIIYKLKSMGFTIISTDKNRMSKISWPYINRNFSR